MTKPTPDKSRFDDLFSAARRQTKDAPLSSTPLQPTRKSKSTDPDYVRTTVYLPKQLHQQLKIAAATGEKDMSGIVEELIANWLKSKSDI